MQIGVNAPLCPCAPMISGPFRNNFSTLFIYRSLSLNLEFTGRLAM